MRLWVLGLCLCFLTGCAGNQQERTSAPPPPTPPASAEPAAPARPELVALKYGDVEVKAGGQPREKIFLPKPAHITATVHSAISVQWMLTDFYGGPGTTPRPMQTLPAREISPGVWAIDLETPPNPPMILTLYAEVPPGVPDELAFDRYNGKRSLVLASQTVAAENP